MSRALAALLLLACAEPPCDPCHYHSWQSVDERFECAGCYPVYPPVQPPMVPAADTPEDWG